MDVLLCAACGRRPTEPVRRLDEMPEGPGRDGLSGPDGPLRPPALLSRGTYAVDPLPHGAPFVPAPDGEEYDAVVPGGRWMSDERGFRVSAGPRGTRVLHPLDVVGLGLHPDVMRSVGCCGPDGEHGVNRLCPCGAEVVIAAADCTSEYATRFVPDVVRTVPA
ncbi:hypothetical protein [Streptomyces broussonetiae]|uniref:Uncharacterized protein n=1 Tax=Streptomyces broussonetiae TaxID=2686304 RepID=A0A6I6N924_9ACTN|nr:hypothetical protein [Streptomyces broussonetiae]QHA07031.1 hypothetical protein GQF42_30370 [Streptomyces broussonetiae]